MALSKMIICSPQYGLTPNSNAGGEVYDEHVLKGLADHGIQIEIILPYGKPYDKEQSNWHVHHLPLPFIHTSYLFNFAIIPQLIAIYKRTKFDILRIHSPYLVGIGAWIFKKIFHPNVKLVATYLHFENKLIFKIIDRLFIKKWDLIVTISESTKEVLIKKYKIPENKIVLAYPGVDEKYKPSVKHDEIINRYGLENKFVLVFCGYLIKRKNVSFLLNVMRKIDNKDIVLVIIGDGPEKENLKNLANHFNMQKNVIFTGYVSEEEKNKILQSSDLFVFPSLMEGFGMAPVEAMACGLPAMVSDCGSLHEVVGNAGIVMPLNVESWAKGIRDLRRNTSRLHLLRDKSLKRAKEFTWSASIKKLESAFQQIARL